MEKCKDCRFWSNKVDEHSGQCRAHTPDQSLSQGWPTSAATEWCGEFEPKTQSVRAIVVSYRSVIEGRESPWTAADTHGWVDNDLVLQAIKAMEPQAYRDGDPDVQVQTQYVREDVSCLEWRICMVEVWK